MRSRPRLLKIARNGNGELSLTGGSLDGHLPGRKIKLP